MVKVRFNKPSLEPCGIGNVYRVASQSRPGLYHYVIALKEPQPDGLPQVRCSCEGFQMHKKCWHTEEVSDEEGIASS